MAMQRYYAPSNINIETLATACGVMLGAPTRWTGPGGDALRHVSCEGVRLKQHGAHGHTLKYQAFTIYFQPCRLNSMTPICPTLMLGTTQAWLEFGHQLANCFGGTIVVGSADPVSFKEDAGVKATVTGDRNMYRQLQSKIRALPLIAGLCPSDLPPLPHFLSGLKNKIEIPSSVATTPPPEGERPYLLDRSVNYGGLIIADLESFEALTARLHQSLRVHHNYRDRFLAPIVVAKACSSIRFGTENLHEVVSIDSEPQPNPYALIEARPDCGTCDNAIVKLTAGILLELLTAEDLEAEDLPLPKMAPQKAAGHQPPVASMPVVLGSHKHPMTREAMTRATRSGNGNGNGNGNVLGPPSKSVIKPCVTVDVSPRIRPVTIPVQTAQEASVDIPVANEPHKAPEAVVEPASQPAPQSVTTRPQTAAGQYNLEKLYKKVAGNEEFARRLLVECAVLPGFTDAVRKALESELLMEE